MQLREIMTRDVQVIGPEATGLDAAKMMRDLDIGALPVCKDDRLQGFVTDRDLVVRGVAAGENLEQCRIQDLMSKGITWCFEDDEVESAAELMRDKQIRRLAVLSRDKRLVGVVSLGDLAVQGEDEELAGEALEGISEPAQPSA